MEKGGALTGESEGLGRSGGGPWHCSRSPLSTLPAPSHPPPRRAFFSSFCPIPVLSPLSPSSLLLHLLASLFLLPPAALSISPFPRHCLLRQSKHQPKASKTEKENLLLKFSKANRHAFPKLWPVSSRSSRWEMEFSDALKCQHRGLSARRQPLLCSTRAITLDEYLIPLCLGFPFWKRVTIIMPAQHVIVKNNALEWKDLGAVPGT